MDAIKQNILVTGIGGVVGQGVIKNIRRSFPNFAVFGTDTNPFSTGHFLCDDVKEVPEGNDPDYIQAIKELCSQWSVCLVIPGTDLEMLLLKKHEKQLSCPVAGSPFETVKFCYDKWLCYEALQSRNIPFARSFINDSDIPKHLSQLIAKPRKGRGSRGIIINPKKIGSLLERDYLIQEFWEGIEITTAFFVNRENKVLGEITFKRDLVHGNTTFAEVTFEHRTEINKIIHALIENYSFRGSLNIQSIVTKNGEIVPFEINCRVSGTNSFRYHFGMKDIEYTIQDYLMPEIELQEMTITKGCVVRHINDVVYPGIELKNIKNKNDIFTLE